MQNFDFTKKYVLAVSGGIDSMVMLHYFAGMSPRLNFSVATVNHGIRTDAQSDCEFVKNYCNEIGVDCEIYSVNVPKYSREHKLSEETSARLLRYGVLEDIECDYVCLAHHKGDNAETVLMHILRGSGSLGACGIRKINGKYLRPLLDWSREDIEKYAQDNGVKYVTDSTNNELKYNRNYLRREIMPALKRLNPLAVQNIVRFAENIAQDNDYLESLADISEVQFYENKARIPVKLLMQAKPVAYRIFRKSLERLGVYKDIEKTHVDAIIELTYNQGGKRVYLPFGYVAINDYDYITIEQSQDKQDYCFEIPFATGMTVTPIGIVEISQIECEDCLKIDANKIPQNAVFRTKRHGDVFEKFGGGSKSLKKYLIDKKIPQRQRDELVLIADGNEVLVICGIEISDKVKVTDNSQIYYISIKKEIIL